MCALAVAAIGGAAGAAPVAAQDTSVVVPGDGTLDGALLQPFEAEYEQVGYPFFVRLVLAGSERPTWSFQMIMEGPTGVGIDHVGHFADDLSMAYRRFAFGAFRNEYVDVSAEDGGLTVRRMPLEDDRESFAPVRVPAETPVFDGTFVYWLLGLAPLTEGASLRFRTWSPTAEGAETRTSSPVEVGAPETLTLSDGATVRAWPVVSATQGGRFISWVMKSPPYLVRQEMVGEEGTVTPVIELKRLR